MGNRFVTEDHSQKSKRPGPICKRRSCLKLALSGLSCSDTGMNTENLPGMSKNRLEAFSDGVLAIIITIMVLELKVPHGSSWEDIKPLGPVMLSYVLSFIYVGIYWNNHHHVFQAVKKVNGKVLWANMHLLFWLSLTPFVTAWAGENHFDSLPVALYGVVLFMAGGAYSIMMRTLITHHGKDWILTGAIGKDFKGNISVVLYALAIGLAFWNSWISVLIYAVVAAIWIVPDSRIEQLFKSK
jgi:uncharacterized membrane protein